MVNIWDKDIGAKDDFEGTVDIEFQLLLALRVVSKSEIVKVRSVTATHAADVACPE